MIAVTPHHVGDIAVYPFLKEIVGTLKTRSATVPTFQPFPFGELPLIAGLIHDEQTEGVAELIDHRCLWVVAHTDGVHTYGLQVDKPSFPHVTGHDGAKHTCVVVQADALHLHVDTIEQEALVGVEFQCSQPHTHGAAVDDVTRLCIAELGLHRVEIAAADVPQMRLWNLQQHRLPLPATYGGLLLCHLPMLGVVDGYLRSQ